jgi:sugar (pentulose or hexulose) kinase
MFLGLDIGTGSAKAVLLDERGSTVAEAGAGYSVEAPHPGWGETRPAAWWDAICKCVGDLPAAPRAAVKAIGLSAQMHGVVLADANGEPLRPAILWMDSRAAPCVARYPAGAARRVRNPISAGMAGPILLWLMQFERDRFAQARWALQPKDWLRFRLTGAACTEPSDASATLFADGDGRWDQTLLAELGIAAELLPPLAASAEVTGQLTPGAAQALGLPQGIPVAGGAGATAAAAFGSGLYEDGAAQLTTGSGAQIVVMQARQPDFSPRLNAYRSASIGPLPRWYVMAAMQNCGVALEWVRATLGLSWDEAYERAFAADVPSRGPLFLPYLAGERTPWMDPDIRGAWVGLSPGDSAGSMMRAAFLGVAFGIRAGLEALQEHGIGISRLRLAGGGSVHPAWRRLLMDVLHTPLDAVSCPNASARGAALLGGVATGFWTIDDLIAMAPALVSLGEPADNGFDESYARFRDLYQRLAGWSAAAARAEPAPRTTTR